MSESNAPDLIKYLTEDNLKLMYGRLNRRYMIVDALPSADSMEPADMNVIYVVKETVGKTVRYWPNVLENDAWRPFGIGQVDLDGKADKVSSATNGHLAGLDASGNLIDSGYKAADFSTAEQGTKADTAYQKPDDGIPKSDLDSGVRASLGKADTALQEHQDISGKVDKVDGKDLSTNDFTDNYKERLDNIEDGAEVNVIETIKVNDAVQPVIEKTVNIDLSGKADKSEMGITDVSGDASKKTFQLKAGLSQDVVVSHQDVSGKSDKVPNATSGNFAGLDANGNLTDSGSKAADFAKASDIPPAITVDSAMSTTSENPVQNKVVTDAVNGKSSSTAIAPEYSDTSTYPTVGTAVMHGGLRYVSNTAIATAEDWTADHWTEKSVEDEIGNLEILLAAL